MKARELRIGNYLYGYFNTNEGFEKQSFQISHLVIAEIAEFTHDYEPIPLTEEWLIKLGFTDGNEDERKEFGFTNKDWFKRNPWFYVYQETDEQKRLKYNFRDEIVGEFYVYANQYYVRGLKYVHELQNLYFALKGQELEIKH